MHHARTINRPLEVKPNLMGKAVGPADYPYRLNFYIRPPIHEITIEEFESCAIDRLRILGEIESCFARNRTADERKTVIRAQCTRYLPMDPNDSLFHAQEEQRRRDHVGHFVLRLAFCRSEELRRRFVKAELELFRVRYEDELDSERKGFLSQHDFGTIEVTESEKTQYSQQLRDASPRNYVSMSKKVPAKQLKDETYFKVKWTRVPDLIEHRRVFVKGGWAYVPASEQFSLIFHEFESRLERELESTYKALKGIEEDTRLGQILDHLSKGFMAGGIAPEWGTEGTGDEIKADMIDDLARKHFPACMRNLHENLRKDRHLKHFGRLQYGLFLKALGLSIEEALLFWRRSFSKFTDDQFNKNYKYNIRHTYGLEGGRRNYPAKSCQQILTQDQPGTQDNHGCPYRHFSPDNLESALLSMYSERGLARHDIPEILKMVKDGHFHVACTRVFEITHNARGVKKGDGVSGESVSHPNQYAQKSRELEKAQIEAMDIDGGDVVMSS